MIWGIYDQFYGVKAQASHIGQTRGHYSVEIFKADFPQFFNDSGDSHLPLTVLDDFINQANGTITPDKWLDSWRYCSGLFVAHQATMYLRTIGAGAGGSTPTAQAAAMTGQIIGNVASAGLGDASVSYDSNAGISGTAEWGDLNMTTYGQLLANKAKLIGMGGSYVL